jgi:type III secretion protein R
MMNKALFSLLILFALPLSAAEPVTTTGPPSIVTVMTILFSMGMLPYIVMLLTSFTKIVIVMSLLRNALGVQQAPPNQVITGISLILTTYIMFPTGLKMYNAAQEFMKKTEQVPVFDQKSPAYMAGLLDATKEPMRDFLFRNTRPDQLKSFYQTAYKILPPEFRSELKAKDLIVLVPAYIITQLKGAFEIGVLIYLPFFVIDLVVSNILLAMGMMMLSPLTIALPLKLLLVVMVDGWSLLTQGLVFTYR